MNKMSDLVRSIFANIAFFASATIYINSSILIKSAKAILKAISMLNSIIERGLSSIIFSKMSFVIDRRFYFLVWNSFFLPDDKYYLRIIKARQARAPINIVRLEG